jgi:Animal haem peroxidase
VIGPTSPAPSSGGIQLPDEPVSQPHDLPRRPDKTAIVPDSRNDQNLVVAQTHLAFLKFHNRVIDTLPHSASDDDPTARFSKREEDSRGTAFHRASRLVRWHYQWIALHDFLPRIVDPDVLQNVLDDGRRFFEFGDRPFMPVEFSVAAYRLGHSMVREAYNYNRVFNSNGPPALTRATLGLLFQFTGKGGFRGPQDPSLPTDWVIDWRRFHEVGRPDLLNFARRIDTKVTPQLHALPAGVAIPPPDSLPVRNLLRGSRLGLPKAQDVAEAIGVQALTPDEIATGPDGAIARAHGLDRETPLWYYILKEADARGDGQRLGPLGSRIVSEAFVGFLEGDRNSFLARDRHWKPTLPGARPDTFTMADLLNFVGELNPLGPGPEGP